MSYTSGRKGSTRKEPVRRDPAWRKTDGSAQNYWRRGTVETRQGHQNGDESVTASLAGSAAPPPSALENRIWGGLLGGTIGDAMGKPTHRLSRNEIQARFGRVGDLKDTTAPPCHVDPSRPVISPDSRGATHASPVPVPAGCYTDVTRLKHLLCDAVIAADGHVGALEVAEHWLANMDPFEFYYPVFASYFKLHFAVASPRDNGIGNIPSNSSAMAIAPIGLINPGDPRLAALEAFDVASLIHTGVARDAACLVAAGVAACLSPGATVEGVVEAALAAARPEPPLLDSMERALAQAQQATSEGALLDSLCESSLWPLISRDTDPGNPGYAPTADPREAVPCAFAMFCFSRGDPQGALLCAANFGRDALATGAIVGALAGTFSGADAIPQSWRLRVEAENPRTDAPLARTLAAIVRRDLGITQHRLTFLRTLAGGFT